MTHRHTALVECLVHHTKDHSSSEFIKPSREREREEILSSLSLSRLQAIETMAPAKDSQIERERERKAARKEPTSKASISLLSLSFFSEQQSSSFRGTLRWYHQMEGTVSVLTSMRPLPAAYAGQHSQRNVLLLTLTGKAREREREGENIQSQSSVFELSFLSVPIGNRPTTRHTHTHVNSVFSCLSTCVCVCVFRVLNRRGTLSLTVH